MNFTHKINPFFMGNYLALKENLNNIEIGSDQLGLADVERLNDVSSSIIREVIIPEIEKEVNEGENFANLRQIFHSMVLATWFKHNLKESLLGKVYIEKNKVKGINVEDKTIKEKIYKQYLEAFKAGVYNYIKEDYDTYTGKVIPRKYFSGGYQHNPKAVREQNVPAVVLGKVIREEIDDNSVIVKTFLEPFRDLDQLYYILDRIAEGSEPEFKALPDDAREDDILMAAINYIKRRDNGRGHLIKEELDEDGNTIYIISDRVKTTSFGQEIVQKVMGLPWEVDRPKSTHMLVKEQRADKVEEKGIIVAFEDEIESRKELEKEELRFQRGGYYDGKYYGEGMLPIQAQNEVERKYGNNRIVDIEEGRKRGFRSAQPAARIVASLGDLIEKKTSVEQFVKLDTRIQAQGFWGITADDRWEYLDALLHTKDVAEYSQFLSEEFKLKLNSLPRENKESFSQISRLLLAFLLDYKKQLPEVRTLDYLSNSPKVLLIAPWERKELKIGSYLAPPLGIYRLANYLRLMGVQVDLFDPNLHSIDKLTEMVSEEQFDVIGTSTYSPTIDNDIELSRQIKKVSPNSIFIVGGEAAQYNKDKLMSEENPFDITIRGFGEFPLLDIIYMYYQKGIGILQEDNVMNGIKGIYWRDKNNGINSTPSLEQLVLDDYRVISLFFDSSIVPYEEYWNHMENLFSQSRLDNGKALDINAIRTVRSINASHCNIGCTFCSSTNFLADAYPKSGIYRYKTVHFKRRALSAWDLVDAIIAEAGTNLGRKVEIPKDRSSEEAAVDWLNNSIIPYQLFIHKMSLADLPTEGIDLITLIQRYFSVQSFDELSENQLTHLTQLSDGERLKRLILSKLYPGQTPETPRLVHSVLMLSPEEIIQILKNIKIYHPEVRTIFFNDDDFLIRPSRVVKLCDAIEKEFGRDGFRFIALGRIDKVNPEVLRRMRDVGFFQINYGIEHFVDHVLKDMHKFVTEEQAIKGLKWTLEAGITPLINLIPFYPTASTEDVKKTMDISMDFVNKGGKLAYWPFVERFSGATIFNMGYEVDEDYDVILPVDPETRKHALSSIKKKAEVIEEIKKKYNIDKDLPHVVDVLSFFLSFYREAGIPTDYVESTINKIMNSSGEPLMENEIRGILNQSSSPARNIQIDNDADNSNLGGIDFNPGLLDLRTLGMGIEFNVIFDPQKLETVPITGLTPVIFQIVPVHFPLLLGVSDLKQGINEQLGWL